MGQNWENEIVRYEGIANDVLKKAKALGATQAEVHCTCSVGFGVNVSKQEIEALSYDHASSASITVYIGHQKGQALTTDLRPSALDDTVAAACRIAKLVQPDAANGLVEPEALAKNYPFLDLHHPWEITPAEAAEKAKDCEAQALSVDQRLTHSEYVYLSAMEHMLVYSNTHGFMGNTLSSNHHMNCTVVARDEKGNMQRDGGYTLSRDPRTLQSIEALAKEAGERTIRRLGARRIKTQKTPVIFEARVANELIKCFLNAISGRTLYQQASFLMGQRDQPIFSEHISIEECPYELKGLGSAPFDEEGVAPQTRYLVQGGVLQSYLLDSYSARRLNMKTTGNAGGWHNIKLSTHEPDLNALVATMQKGLVVTEVIGHGINLVTGDYSQGIVGFWVENGKIQYAVEEVTIAGNLKDMYQNIVAIAGDINQTSKIQTGSILMESMTVAGE